MGMKRTCVFLTSLLAIGGCSSDDGGDAAGGNAAGNAVIAGTPSTGATTAGMPSTGAATAGAVTGGETGAGGTVAAGGEVAAGGDVARGGTVVDGGAVAAGGTVADGGAVAAGGTVAEGGAVAAGGTVAEGGAVAAGGVADSGGAAPGGNVGAGGQADVGGMAPELPNLADTAQNAGSFMTLLAAAQATGLVPALTGNDPLTVFAPTDAAFEALPEGALDALLANPEALTRVLKAHIIAGTCDADCVLAGEPKVSLDPTTQLLGTPAADANAQPTVRAYGDTNVANIATPNIAASNGIIHVIDKVLMPTVELSVDLSCAGDNGAAAEADAAGVFLTWSLAWDTPVPAVADLDDNDVPTGVYRVKLAMHVGEFDYKWRNGATDEDLVGEGFCAPVQNPSNPFATRKWTLEGAENRDDVFGACLACGAQWEQDPVTLTLRVPAAANNCDSPADLNVGITSPSLGIAGNWWESPGLPAVNNGDGTYSFVLDPAPVENFEYLWTVGGSLEDMKGAAPDCRAINSDYANYANRLWLVGSGDQQNEWQSCTECTPVEPPMGGADAGGTPAGGMPAGGMPAGGTPAGGMPAGGTPAGGMPAGGTPAGGMPAGGMPAGGAQATDDNRLTNGDFETFTAPGDQPPYDPPTDWDAFSTAVASGNAVGYSHFATQANGATMFPTQTPYPGRGESRGVKLWGRGEDAGNGDKLETLSTLYQQFTDGVVPEGSEVTLSGYGYHFSGDPLQANNEVYLVIKCFSANYAANLCNQATSVKITSNTPADAWARYEVTVPSLPVGTVIVQAGIEFHECVGGPCNTIGGALFFDDLTLEY